MSAMTEQERVGARLRALREAAGLSQAQLAQRMHDAGHPWWQPTVSKVESGQRAVPSDEMRAVSEVLGVAPDWAVAA
jgi:transcriptional regulator with XRE-family HTH domain